MTEVAPQWGSVLVEPTAPNLAGLKIRFLLDHLPHRGRVLEIGSGGGKVLRTIHKHRSALELHGCDVRDPQVPADVYAFRKIEPSGALPYTEAGFDVVLLFDVLEHVPDPRALLGEAARVLRPGGRLVAFIPVEGEWFAFHRLWRCVLGDDLYVETKEHVQAFTHRELRGMIRDRFEPREVRYAYHLLGQMMDATFFAAMRLSAMKTFWWRDNAIYHGKRADSGPFARVMNALMETANVLAWFESTALSRTALLSTGVLLEAVRRN